MVEADGCGFKVPFSDDRRVVTIGMEFFGDGPLGLI